MGNKVGELYDFSRLLPEESFQAMGQRYGRGNPSRVDFLSRGNIAESLERSR